MSVIYGSNRFENTSREGPLDYLTVQIEHGNIYEMQRELFELISVSCIVHIFARNGKQLEMNQLKDVSVQ